MFHLETVSAEGFPAKELDNTFSAKLRLSKMVENCFLYISIKKNKDIKIYSRRPPLEFRKVVGTRAGRLQEWALVF